MDRRTWLQSENLSSQHYEYDHFHWLYLLNKKGLDVHFNVVGSFDAMKSAVRSVDFSGNRALINLHLLYLAGLDGALCGFFSQVLKRLCDYYSEWRLQLSFRLYECCFSQFTPLNRRKNEPLTACWVVLPQDCCLKLGVVNNRLAKNVILGDECLVAKAKRWQKCYVTLASGNA